MKRLCLVLVTLALVALSGFREATADDVFYAAPDVDAKALGTTPRPITVPGSSDKAPKSAPKNSVVVRHNLERNERVEILRINPPIRSFSASTKGDRLTYMVVGGPKAKGDWRIFATDLDGKPIGKLTAEQFKAKANGGVPSGTPVLSPDDSAILFSSRISPAPRALATDRIVAFHLKSESFTDLGPGILPSWSPDGKSILFTDTTGDRPENRTYRLGVMNFDGSGRKAVAEQGTLDGSFSPDGKAIAFVKIVGGASEVWTCNADGTAPKKVSAPKSLYSSPRLLADGRRLSVVAVQRDLQAAVDATLARMKGPKGGKAGPPPKGPRPAEKGGADGRASDGDLRDVFVISTENSNVRRLTGLKPDAPDDIDFFVNRSVLVKIKNAASVQFDLEMPVYAPPAGWAVAFRGTKVLLVEAKSGATKPLPDGRYRLTPGGHIIFVSGGEKTIPNFGLDDDY